VVRRLEHDDVLAVDQVDEAVLLVDPPRPADLDRAALTRRLAEALRVVAVVASTEDWGETYGKLLAWVEGHEGRFPSKRTTAGSEERSLATWANRQRQAKKNGKMTSERAALLEAVPGWRW